MIQVSFDPDAGTLYWYFTEIEVGSTAIEGECDGALLLDGTGQVIGLELELDGSIKRSELALALAHPQVRYDRSAATLTIQIADEEPAEVQPLHEPVILDFDRRDRLQGCEVLAAAEFGLAERLERLAPVRISLEDDDPAIDAAGGEGPVVFAMPAIVDDETQDEIDDAETDERSLTEAALPEEEEDDDEDDGDGDEENDEEDEDQDDDQYPEDEQDDGEDEDEDDENDDDQDGENKDEPAFERPTASTTVADGFRSGFVALVGKPNVGKSTLLNALLGQKIAIVSPKPQTTRTAMRGILNRPDAQVVFVDTPGIHDPRTKLGTYMVEQARRSIPDADVVCFVVDIATPPNRTEQRIAALATRSRATRILVLNKLDQRTQAGQQHLAAYRELGPWDMEVAISALRRKGLETLLDEIVRRLPAGPPLYPDDQLTDQTERDHAAELVREQVLRLTEQEVPHGVAVEVEEWEEKEHATYIRMTIYVEKDSQKGILIGASGAMLKKIGSAARAGIEQAIGRPAYLDLWVKARPNWRDDPSSLRWLGYRSEK